VNRTSQSLLSPWQHTAQGGALSMRHNSQALCEIEKLGEGSHAPSWAYLRWRCCLWKNPRLEESTALAWLVYAKIDLVSLILRGRAMQGNALFGGQLQRFGDQVDPLR